MARLILITILIALGSVAQAQSPEMADRLRENGKIYVVVAVIAIIFVCLALFLTWLDRRISRIERELKKKQGP